MVEEILGSGLALEGHHRQQRRKVPQRRVRGGAQRREVEENQGQGTKSLLKGRNGLHSQMPQKIQSHKDWKASVILSDSKKAERFCQSCLNGVEGLEARLQWVRSEWEAASVDNSPQKCGHLAGGR